MSSARWSRVRVREDRDDPDLGGAMPTLEGTASSIVRAGAQTGANIKRVLSFGREDRKPAATGEGRDRSVSEPVVDASGWGSLSPADAFGRLLAILQAVGLTYIRLKLGMLCRKFRGMAGDTFLTDVPRRPASCGC